MRCSNCENKDKCLDNQEIKGLRGCSSGIPRRKKTTNADRIRSMTDEELAEFLKEYFSCEYGCPAHKTACICDCNEAIIKWLQKDSEV